MIILTIFCILWFSFQLFRVVVMEKTLDKLSVVCLLLIAIAVNINTILRY